MLSDDVLDGIVCCICYEDFTDTEGARIGHGTAVVCHECWDAIPSDQRKNFEKACFFTKSYVYNITVPINGEMTELTVKPLHNIDQVVYEIYDERLLCVVGLNEKANWDADRNINRNLIYHIGKAIDEKEKK